MDPMSRLKSFEDGFTERKVEGVKSDDICKTMVAFANSIPEGRTGILFIGVTDKGQIKGVSEPDSLQKTIRRIAENESYPAIRYSSEILDIEGKKILAVVVPHSKFRPHFSGPAYVRVGSESVKASEKIFEELIASRNSKSGKILSYKGKIVTVRWQVKKEITQRDILGPRSIEGECKIITCNAHYVQMHNINNGANIAEPLDNVTISFDTLNTRPMLFIKLP